MRIISAVLVTIALAVPLTAEAKYTSVDIARETDVGTLESKRRRVMYCADVRGSMNWGMPAAYGLMAHQSNQITAQMPAEAEKVYLNPVTVFEIAFLTLSNMHLYVYRCESIWNAQIEDRQARLIAEQEAAEAQARATLAEAAVQLATEQRDTSNKASENLAVIARDFEAENRALKEQLVAKEAELAAAEARAKRHAARAYAAQQLATTAASP